MKSRECIEPRGHHPGPVDVHTEDVELEPTLDLLPIPAEQAEPDARRRQPAGRPSTLRKLHRTVLEAARLPTGRDLRDSGNQERAGVARARSLEIGLDRSDDVVRTLGDRVPTAGRILGLAQERKAVYAVVG